MLVDSAVDPFLTTVICNSPSPIPSGGEGMRGFLDNASALEFSLPALWVIVTVHPITVNLCPPVSMFSAGTGGVQDILDCTVVSSNFNIVTIQISMEVTYCPDNS